MPAPAQPTPVHPPTLPPAWSDASPVDLHVASSARALMATRNSRTSGRHLRRLPPHSKHVAFVIDSGCTHHIHPCLSDLRNTVSCGTS
eukprot:862745-Pleurochrysis_carterae.AAC.1